MGAFIASDWGWGGGKQSHSLFHSHFLSAFLRHWLSVRLAAVMSYRGLLSGRGAQKNTMLVITPVTWTGTASLGWVTHNGSRQDPVVSRYEGLRDIPLFHDSPVEGGRRGGGHGGG